MVDIYIRYEGDLHSVTRHGPSGATFTTDAPVDNNGRGESFSPTDLVATGLGCCMVTVMGILAKKRRWELSDIDVHVKKEMTKEPPRRIARLSVELKIAPNIADKLDAAARAELEHAANTCPVRLSILPAIDVPVTFSWGEAAR